MMPNSRLFHYAIGDMTDAYFPIYRKIFFSDGAIPYIMVPFAVTHKMTIIFKKNLPDFFLVFSPIKLQPLELPF
ncbi:hypothetical protein R84B8_02038 [Treponema sp. R8-4-B8]